MSLSKDYIDDNYIAQMDDMRARIDALERAVVTITSALETDIIFKCEDTGALYRPVVKTTDGVRPRLYLRPVQTDEEQTFFALGGSV